MALVLSKIKKRDMFWEKTTIFQQVLNQNLEENGVKITNL